ncbi:hypothetical protein UB31_21110 [Bradyrhizobium sp. LTSP849]|uniref:hypothetical protein n=1 Tax=Bradyrhizobium sp. LTSP849 TaxID=1615890 RepID=UPI0005D13C61|nr:hypothetical protein [Bradyrhizobium sp. LTSP849]KJC45185.1 hypothetical protein UB31_21110 [Bradyrhizobium sp. LTSP849]
MVGFNDFALNEPVAVTFENYRKIIDRLAEQKVNVYIQSTLEAREQCAEGYLTTFASSTSFSAPMLTRMA